MLLLKRNSSDLLSPDLTKQTDNRTDSLSATDADSIGYCKSFIQTISMAPLQVHFYSEALPTQHGYCAGVSRRSVTGNCELKNLSKVPTWRLERESNPRPSGRKLSTQPMRQHVSNAPPCQVNWIDNSKKLVSQVTWQSVFDDRNVVMTTATLLC